MAAPGGHTRQLTLSGLERGCKLRIDAIAGFQTMQAPFLLRTDALVFRYGEILV